MFNRSKNSKAFSIIFYRTLIGLSNRLTQYFIPLFIIFLNWNDFYYGLIFAVAGYIASGMIIGLGYITDVRKRKYTMIAGLGAAGISMFLFYASSFTDMKGWMIAAYSLFGVSRSLTQISLTTLLADVTPSKEEKTKFFGYMHFFWNLAGVAAPLMGGAYLTIYANYRTHYGSFTSFNGGNFSDFHLIADKSTYMNMILFIAIFLIVTMFLTFKFPIADTSKEEAKDISRGEDWKEYEKGSKKPLGFQLLAFFFCEAIIGFTSGVAIPFIRKYMIEDLLATDMEWAIILAASNAGIAFGSLAIVPLSNKIGNEKILAILHFAVPALALGLALSPGLILGSIFFVFRSSSANMSRPAWNSFFYSWLPPQYRGSSTGFVSAGRRLTRALGTTIGGYIYTAAGRILPWTFPVVTLAYPIAIMIPIIMQRFLKKNKEEETAEVVVPESIHY